MHLSSPLLAAVPGVLHGFGGAEEAVPAPFAPRWPPEFPRWKQVHGAHAVEVVAARQEAGDCDALWTRVPGRPIAVIGADCTPILVAREDGELVAAVHAGWRGTKARIVQALLSRLRAEGEQLGRFVAAIGPVIGKCCYEVGEDLAADYAREFAEAGPGVAVPAHRRLDLAAVNAWQLRVLGVERVDVLAPCTRCAVDAQGRHLYRSYRREGRGPQQYAAIERF
jgi:YfiH family protein